MSNVPRDTPTPAPTAIIFGVPRQSVASVADAHVVFEAVAAVPALLVIGMPVLPLDTIALSVIVSVMAAALVGSPIAGLAVDRTAVSVQQFVLVSSSSRQQ
jgi:hypothetical protein